MNKYCNNISNLIYEYVTTVQITIVLKPLYSPKENTVDGSLGTAYRSSTLDGEEYPWVVIDLEDYYVVKYLRIISAQNKLLTDRFISIAVSQSAELYELLYK